ncbi:SGNH/GDSL hydrolase family protein [Prosthecobacter vanneervenii]|uniref:Acyl-CoA thioesterase-1 n=1 Tax=Prosthecobacter vanneervenii TaxID=48466 RepID=A0A7W8DKL7_9BACT|nr:SGNH/GDSL hydrolase family protein [Prosthecobacter vanneervenii]MBB5033394.1 acyl-CoA thioesterase-1 [Prosthecobacter vanneervenii]
MPRVLLVWFVLSFGVFAQSPEARRVILFGDSITAGGALPQEERAKLWVTQVQAQSAGDLILINEGKGGRPTNSLPEFEQMLARNEKADALVIALGMNDSRDITSQCVPKAVANVRAMIERARAVYGAKLPVLIVGPSNINKSALGPTKPIANEREAKLRELGAAFEKLAAETQCEFVSLFGVVPDASLHKDGVHPDGAGNTAIAKKMGPSLRALR